MITFREYNSFIDLENLQEEWDRCVLECNSPVYMTFDWCQKWWSFYGVNNELSVLLFFNDSSLIGILPLYIEKINFGPLHLRVCKLVGANIPPKVFNPPLQNGYKNSIISKTRQYMLNDRCDIISLGPVSDRYFDENVVTALNDKSEIHLNSKSNYEPYSYFELPQSFDEYLDSINPKDKKDFKYNFKRLNRDNKINVVINKNFNQEDFFQFLDMHHTQWIKQGKLGHFNSWPRGKEFNLALAKKLAAKDKYSLLKVLKNDEVIFYSYGYKLGDGFYGQLSARSISTENQKFSLGNLGMILLVKTLIDEKINFIEAGLGYYDYKIRLGAKLSKTFIYRFLGNQKQSAVKYQLLELEKKIGGALFHKIWYRRIQPTLPVSLKQPISNRSIKLDY